MKYSDVLFGFIFIITDTNPYNDGVHIAFLLDGSMGVSWSEYGQQKDFVFDVAETLRRDTSTQFDAAVVEYSDEATLVFNFTQTYEFSSFLFWFLYGSGKSDGRQRVDKALTFTSKYVFASTGQDIPKIAVLFAFTEHLQPGYPLGKASESLRQKGVRILVVEVNSINPREELVNVTEREDDLVHITSIVESTYEFDNLVNKVLKAIGKY